MFRRKVKHQELVPGPAELAALADGSLAPERERMVSELVSESPALAAMVSEQAYAIGLVRGATAQAPARLRAAVRSHPAFEPRRSWYRRPLVSAAAGAMATAAAFVSLSLAGGSGQPTVAQAAVFAQRAPAMAAPAENPARPGWLLQAVDGVAYPDWSTLHLSVVGQRRDQIGGREAITVFYATKGGATVGYTIVAGSPLAVTRSVAQVTRWGTTYQVVSTGGRAIVTWQRAGHTCILSSAGAPATTLVQLAGAADRTLGYRAPATAWGASAA